MKSYRAYSMAIPIVLLLTSMETASKNNDVNIGDKKDSIFKNISSHNTLNSHSQSSHVTTRTKYGCKHSLTEKITSCPTDLECKELAGNCVDCDFNCTCIYGDSMNVSCSPKKGVSCLGTRTFEREIICQYCYQTDKNQHECSGSAECPAVSSPRQRFRTNCTVLDEMICLGNRTFPKMVLCNWTSGYDWITVLIISITLGGFGADRFYLGHWREGIGKLLSFGGLGVWTIIDVFLILIRYLGPANHSLYMEWGSQD